MKELRWNLGIIVIRFGYWLRKSNWKPIHSIKKIDYNLIRWKIGVFIVKYGYTLRGGMPYKTWKWNHV